MADDRIDLPARAVSGLEDRTYELWLRTSAAGGGLFRLDQWGGCCPGDYLVLNGDGTLLGHHFSGGNILLRSATAVGDGQWHHVALVLSGVGGVGLWVDGVEEAWDGPWPCPIGATT
ncbi:MAG: hypothetical protein H7A46_13300 [Verrucomicrobiales bacterium]|nr:hypothetical protein [Verrucomicrobiales bacterium]